MKNCRDITRLLSARLERPVSPGERFQMGVHCMMCASCRQFGEQMLVLRRLSRRFVGPDRPDDKNHGPR